MKTNSIKNVFTVGNVEVEFTESKPGDEGSDGSEGEREYKMVPGHEIIKTAILTVKANSEKCWLFAKVEKSANFDTYLTTAVADGWTKLDGVKDVYYISVEASSADQEFNILKDNKVTVKQEVTKEQLSALTSSGATLPYLTITGYVIQADGFDTAALAWAALNGEESSSN